MAPGWHLIVLCILTASPRALVAFSPPALAASQSAWKGYPQVARRGFLGGVGVQGRRSDSEQFVKNSVGLAKQSVESAWKQKPQYPKEISVTTEDELDALLASGVELDQLRVEGAVTGGKTHADHPVLKILQDRRASGSKAQARTDGHKVALVIEGGGMRGCVSAGMIASITDLGFGDGIDGVFGSSAGSLVGAYFVGNQTGMPQYGCSLYYDLLTDELGKTKFIDRSQALNLLGFGPLRWLTLRPLKEMLGLRVERPMLNLDYPLKDCVEKLRPLDWERFWSNNEKTPLHIMASDIEGGRAVVLHAAERHFESLREMTKCMTASMCLPAVAGTLAKEVGEYMAAQKHREVYARDILRLNSLARPTDDTEGAQDLKGQLLTVALAAGVVEALTVALAAGVVEVKRIEKSRGVIFEGVRSGYRAGHQALAGLGSKKEVEAAVEQALPLECIREPALLSGPAWLERFAGTFGTTTQRATKGFAGRR
ncbi:acyl transferase/acyl hydrolase/lysophospholipase [Baffinella frigidus]|nr:acyl transferase/acyl hydrolase/lysophospholipase [Cryptophyta sp. CCMP2293]